MRTPPYDLRPAQATARGRHRSGVTLVESMLAMTILSVVLVAVLHATVAGHQHVTASTRQLDAGRVAEQLIEEARSRPYAGTAATRSGYGLPDYHGLAEDPGSLRDGNNTLLDPARQRYRRSVEITDTTFQLVGLDNLVIPARQITVTTEDDAGTHLTLTSIVTEPIVP